MDHISQDPVNLPRNLNIESILQVYRLALHILGDSPSSNTLLQRLFASAILVPCSSSAKHGKRCKFDLTNRNCEEMEEAESCPVCSPQTNNNGLKRSVLHSPAYHLVPSYRACWQRARMPSSNTVVNVGDIELFDEDNEGDDDGLKITLPPIDSASVCSPPRMQFPRRVELCNVYSSEWKSFFCDVLKVILS